MKIKKLKEAKKINKERLIHIVNRLNKSRVMVVGDVMLDEFIWGSVSRISPEAPVPVVWVKSESYMPGGALNVANNIAALGGKAFIAGIVGDDHRGQLLTEEALKRNINVEGLIVDANRPTTLKTRIIAHHQQVVRIDKEDTNPVDSDILRQVTRYVREKIQDIDGIIIEDYGKGLVVPELVKELVNLGKKYKKVISVDPKEEHFSYYKGITVMTPNNHEASKAVGFEIKDEDTLIKAGRELVNKLSCDAVLITLGENGMCLFENSKRITHIPTVAQEVFDVSGAGDTVIATFTLGLSCGAGKLEAAHIANFAAGIVVGKVGTATTTQDELLERICK